MILCLSRRSITHKTLRSSIWLSSAASPLILFIALRRGFYKLAAFIILITIVAYLPWKPGPISRCVQSFIDGNHPQYYDGVKIVFEGGEVPPSEHRQTFFAVHPHGAFCIGWALLFTCKIMDGVRFCFNYSQNSSIQHMALFRSIASNSIHCVASRVLQACCIHHTDHNRSLSSLETWSHFTMCTIFHRWESPSILRWCEDSV